MTAVLHALREAELDRWITRGREAARAGDWSQAYDAFDRATTMARPTGVLLGALATCHMQLGRAAQAVATYRRALALDPDQPACHANLILLADLLPETTLESALAERRRWYATHGAPLRAHWRRHENDPDPDRRLAVGYVSGDFKRHSAAFVASPIVLRHSDAVEVTCYSTLDLEREDDVTDAFAAAGRFRRIRDLDPEALAAQIRADGIDVLVDLSGHSAGQRLLTFCLRPAPVQVTGWGYALGTGCPVFDGFFADPYVIREGEAARGYVEPVVKMPVVVPFGPMPYAEPPSALPSLTRGAVTFGSLNRWVKVTPAVLAVWAMVLRRVPESRLILKDGMYEHAEPREVVARAMAAAGVDPARVETRGWTDHGAQQATYDEIDLALDPFPHSGGVTALEGLWRGVPPITLDGDRIPGRLSGSFLTVLGLPEFIARSREDYVERAVAWATTRRAELAEIRAALPARMAASPICDGRYGRTVEVVYRHLWQRWCQRRTR